MQVRLTGKFEGGCDENGAEFAISVVTKTPPAFTMRLLIWMRLPAPDAKRITAEREWHCLRRKFQSHRPGRRLSAWSMV